MEFQAELDLYCLRKALETYMRASKNAKISRYNERMHLSVNVYPSTVLIDTYRKELQNTLRYERLLPGRNLILELSEKTLISRGHSYPRYDINMFENIMTTLCKDFEISFAIDDFGIDYSSISRLNRLTPEYIKVDRDILLQQPKLGKSVINFLHILPIKSRIIIEGLDKESKISLPELVYDLNVKYIQGHILGQATPTIEPRLSTEEFNRIKAILENH